MEKNKILILSVIPSDFSKSLALALLLRSNSFEVEFFFDQRSHSLSDSIKKANDNSFVSYFLNQKNNVKSEEKKEKNDLIRLAKKSKLITFCQRFLNEFKRINSIESFFKSVLKGSEISTVITPVNSCGYNLPVYLNSCLELNIPTICMPFAIGDRDSFRKSIIYSTKSSPKYLYNKFLGFFFKEWKLRINKEDYLILPAEQILAYRMKGIRVKIPASFYGVYTDYLFLENEYMKDHALLQKVASNTVKVTGSVFDNELFHIQKNHESLYRVLCQSNSFNFNKKLILIALPPLIKQSQEDERYFDFKTLLHKFIPIAIDFGNYNVLISVHPRIQKYISGNFDAIPNIAFTTEPVEPLIPLCDLFISTFSSTIRTAVSLNKPVINYDILHFDYTLFYDLKTVKKIDSESDYIVAIQNWMKYEQEGIIGNEESEMNLLNSMIDGRSNERLIHEFSQVLNQNYSNK